MDANINLDAPIYTIEHVALLLGGISKDRAREYSYHAEFPAPKAAFAQNLWLREDVIDWFKALPTRGRKPRPDTETPIANDATPDPPTSSAGATRRPRATIYNPRS